MDQLGLVRGGHHHEVRQAAEVGEIEAARMGRAIGADKAGTVHREAHRQVLDRHVMHDLVVGALQEGRIDQRRTALALGRQAGGEGHGVLFGDADVEQCARGNALPNTSRPVPDGMAAVIATTLGSSLASAIRASAKTLV